jgi:3-hydroxyisobutyrate dehydrogenase-like beta-hydroxyacid dehydrogenase
MFRSIFMKGLTMLLIETLSASHKFGVDDKILESIERSLKKPLHEMANMLITRTAIHAERRLSEMEQVMDTLKEMKLDYTMSEATRQKLQTLVDLELNRHFNYQAPQHYTDVLKQL